jgi:hypothetical protein
MAGWWSMFAALLGFFGVLVGAILTYLFSISSEWRNRRMDAMVAVVTASTRVVGAQERMYGLFQAGDAPPLTDDRAMRALTELSEAHNEWRIARARMTILIPDDEPLKEAIVHFADRREAATECYSDYPKEYVDREHKAWEEMRDARRNIVTCCQIRSQKDARLRERLRLPFSKS